MIIPLIAFSPLPALAATGDDFPSWTDVRAAKGNEAATRAHIAEIEGLLGELRAEAGFQGDAAVEAVANYTQAEAALRAGERSLRSFEERLTQAEEQSAAALKAVAATAAEYYKTGQPLGGPLLALGSPGRALDVLEGMQTLQIVGEYRATSYWDAAEEREQADALRAQVEEATDAREKLALAAAQDRHAAEQQAELADQAVRQQEQQAEILLAQLAELRSTTVALELERQQGLAAEAAYAEHQRLAQAAAKEAVTRAASSSRSGTVNNPFPPASTPDAIPQPVKPPTAETPSNPAPPADPAQPTQPPPTQLPAAPRPTAPLPSAPPPETPAQPTPEPLPVVAVDDPAGAQSYAAGRMSAFGWGAGEFPCLVNLWNRESGWRASADNPYSDAYGIPQALPGSKMAGAGADWRTNYRTQIEWGLGYISGRYGTPCGAWEHSERNNWY